MMEEPEPAAVSKRVLLAEDDVVARNLLTLALQHLGYDVVACGDGQEAWHHFKARSFPIIVSDWDMPELDGLSLCRRIRSASVTSYPYFIMVTAKSSLTDYTAAMETGVDDFLTKPLDKRALGIRLRVAERIIGFQASILRLQEIIPICSYCNKIRSDKDYWEKVENYLEDHTGNLVSHSICPDCYHRCVEPDLDTP